MARRSRQASSKHPANPHSLEDLIIPHQIITSNSGDHMLLWDSEYNTQLRRSILFGTSHSMSDAVDAEHPIVDGTFKSSPNFFTQLVM